MKLPYAPLGEEKLNSLRAKFHGLQILIIDEISMVDHKLLAYIHGRLRQIKQTGDLGIFGNVAVIAVGDFFQLAPVKGKPLFVDEPGLDLWINNFSIVELAQIVRQQDTTFAELLNRLRKRNRKTQLRKEDLEILSNCDNGEENNDSLHIFSTNDEVHEHNLEMLIKTCEEIETIESEDYARSKKTGKSELLDGHHVKVYNTCLSATLLLGINARVMLIKNIDINDGLVNGVCGTVTHIARSDKKKLPEVVYICFDDNNVGLKRRKLCMSEPTRLLQSTPIYAEEENVCTKGGLRRQFPLKLAWACTVHKVQGLTVDSAVVNLKKVFAAGQAYVALSRVRNLPGLTIKDFSEKSIYCNEKVFEALNEMPCFMTHDDLVLRDPKSYFSVFLLNVQS
uniref:ATP-dependent DNA helicase n=1 Tax=Cyprinus carpio TaxID=7962 RepID=A0A8C2FBF5_CYPCA